MPASPANSTAKLETLAPDLWEQVPEECRPCPVLAGRLNTYSIFAEDNQLAGQSWNPLKRAAAVINAKLSLRRLRQDIEGRLPLMGSCSGVLEYPLAETVAEDMCGHEVGEILAAQTQESNK